MMSHINEMRLEHGEVNCLPFLPWALLSQVIQVDPDEHKRQ